MGTTSDSVSLIRVQQVTKETNEMNVFREINPRTKNFVSVVTMTCYSFHKFTVYPFLIPTSQFSISAAPENKMISSPPHPTPFSPFFFSFLYLCLLCDTGYSGQGCYICCASPIQIILPIINALSLVNPVSSVPGGLSAPVKYTSNMWALQHKGMIVVLGCYC